MDHIFDLAEVGGDVEVEARGELGQFCFGTGELQLGIILLDLLLEVGQLLRGVLDLGDVVAVGRLVELELFFVFGKFLLGPLQFEGKLCRRVALTRLEVGLYPGLERGDVLASVVHLPRDPLHKRPILFEPFAAIFHLVDGLVVFILELRDRVGGPEEISNLVHLGGERLPEFAENHGLTSHRTKRNTKTRRQ